MFRVGEEVNCTRGRYKGEKFTVKCSYEHDRWNGGGYCILIETRATIAWGVLKRVRTMKLENK